MYLHTTLTDLTGLIRNYTINYFVMHIIKSWVGLHSKLLRDNSHNALHTARNDVLCDPNFAVQSEGSEQ